MKKLTNLRARVTVMLLLIAVLISASPMFLVTAEAATSSSIAASVVKTAYNYYGRPYIFSASGPFSFDCSGFTRYVYRLYGYYLPHSAAGQISRGAVVAKGNWKVGDLIFFRNTYKAGISHVGIYAGNNKIINAWPHKGVVTMNFVTYRYLWNRYAGARRIIR